MTPSRDELRARLQELGPRAPAPRPDFVARLEARLRAVDPHAVDTEVESPAVAVGRRPGPALALGAAAVVIAVLMLLLPGDPNDRQLGVTGQPTASTSEVEGGVPVPETTTTTATAAPAPPAPTTTATPTRNPAVPSVPRGPETPDRKSVTTRPPAVKPTTTTTTRPPEPEKLGLRCVTGQPDGRPGVECAWTQSTAPAFASYRLWRATGTAPKQVVFTAPDRTTTRYIDREPGVQHYQVEALDGRGRVVGRSSIVEAICC